MLSRRDDPFPFEAVRDLLGLMRALYAAQKAAGAPEGELQFIAQTGKDLQVAISLAAESRPGTVGYAAAWKRAEEATRRAGSMAELVITAEPVLKAAVGRVVKRTGSG